MQEHGWKYKNGPEPFAQVYVPPDGSVRVGSKIGVDFFQADDLLWKKAEELDMIDAGSESQFASDEVETIAITSKQIGETVKLTSSIERSPPAKGTKSPQKTTTRASNNVPVVEEVASDDDEKHALDNTKLCGSLGIMTERSLSQCSSLIKDFLQLGNSGHFMRNLFGPLWKCIADTQGSDVKDIGWSYCKSRGAGALGREYWFCPPKSKGSKGTYGKDYFTTEEALVAHILRELKGYNGFTTGIGNNRQVVADLEIKLSRAIEQHMSYDEVKDTSVSDSRRSHGRAVTNKEPSESDAKSSSPTPKHKRQIYGASPIKIKISSPTPKRKRQKSDTPITTTTTTASISTLKSSNKSPLNSAKKSRKGATSPEKTVTFSQNTMKGAAMLLGLHKASSDGAPVQSPRTPNGYDNVATKRGVKELLKFRARGTKKRKPEDKPEDESPRKREKLSPGAMCHLTQAPEDSESISFQSPQTRRGKHVDNKHLPLHKLFFFGSGVGDNVKKTVDRLGGTFLNDVNRDFLQKNKVEKKVFFLSDVKNRRTPKYVLACALGVPMLNADWLFALEAEYIEHKKKNVGREPSAFDSSMYSRYRLPLGLSNESGLFVLQRARHAKNWSRPTADDSGRLLFDGVSIAVALENIELEKKFVDIIQAAGAKVVNANDIETKDTKLDIVLVDPLTMPPHVTAIPSKVGKILNKVSSYQPNAAVVDLSWVTQCIVQRTRVPIIDGERYKIDMSKSKSPNKDAVVEVYSIKVKQFNGLTRYEVGDSVNFGKRGADLSHGRITSIKHRRKTRTNTVELKVLELHNECELMDGGRGVYSVTIDESQLQGHIVILGGKDFGEVAWSKATNVFMQKKA